MIIEKEFSFDSAHFLPYVADDHKCRRIHGHTYYVIITVEGQLDPKKGWLVDFGDLKTIVKPLIDSLDHRLLNTIPGLENPTAENIAIYIYNKLKPDLDILQSIEVRETPTSRVIYNGK